MPLFGDMMVSPFSYIQSTPNYDENKWQHCAEMALGEGKVDIPGALARIRPQHDVLVSQLSLNDARRQQLTPKIKVRIFIDREAGR